MWALDLLRTTLLLTLSLLRTALLLTLNLLWTSILLLALSLLGTLVLELTRRRHSGTRCGT